PVAGGGLEHVTGEIAQGVLSRAGRAAVHVPMALPHLGRDLREKVGMFFVEPGFEERAQVSAQRFDWQEELGAGGDPFSSVRTEPAAGNQIMNVRMKDER